MSPPTLCHPSWGTSRGVRAANEEKVAGGEAGGKEGVHHILRRKVKLYAAVVDGLEVLETFTKEGSPIGLSSIMCGVSHTSFMPICS